MQGPIGHFKQNAAIGSPVFFGVGNWHRLLQAQRATSARNCLRATKFNLPPRPPEQPTTAEGDPMQRRCIKA
eukprot:9871156-Alexandrium_andersonii.AAC.1